MRTVCYFLAFVTLMSCAPRLTTFNSVCNGVSGNSEAVLATVYVSAKKLEPAMRLAKLAALRSAIYIGIEDNSYKMCSSRGALVKPSQLTEQQKNDLEDLIKSGELDMCVSILGDGFNDPRNRIVVKNRVQFGIDVRINYNMLISRIENIGVAVSFGKLF